MLGIVQIALFIAFTFMGVVKSASSCCDIGFRVTGVTGPFDEEFSYSFPKLDDGYFCGQDQIASFIKKVGCTVDFAGYDNAMFKCPTMTAIDEIKSEINRLNIPSCVYRI